MSQNQQMVSRWKKQQTPGDLTEPVQAAPVSVSFEELFAAVEHLDFDTL